MKRGSVNALRALLLAAAAVAPVSAKEPDHLYGPAPDWAKYRELAEVAIGERLIDPESARIEWLGLYHKGGFKPFLRGRVFGYVGCGVVNARNRMGGYVGRTHFVTVVDYDRVLYAEIDSKPGGLISERCQAAVRSGMLPPLPDTAGADAPEAMASSVSSVVNEASGITIRTMPEGAYVTAVNPGSPAAVAGLKPGMVIASVNAIPLAGMGDAMLKVVDAAGANASLAIVGSETVKLGARP